MKKFRLFLVIFILAGAAGLLRYALFQIFPSSWTVLAINAFGVFCLVFFVKGYLPKKNFSQESLTAIGVGFLGGLTTLSGPLLDLAELVLAKNYGRFLLFLALHLSLGIFVAIVAKFLVEKLEDRS